MDTTKTVDNSQGRIESYITVLKTADLNIIEKNLSSDENDRCIILDFQNIESKQSVLWFRQLRTLYRQYRYIIIGVINSCINLEHAKAANINSLDEIDISLTTNTSTHTSKVDRTADQPHKQSNSAIIVYQNIRSGQRIQHQQDIVIVGNVNPGAEVISGGHIHIYGQLAGRALAGINQRNDAIIYCQSLSAELVAIDRHYHSSDEMPSIRRPVCINLDNETLSYNKT